jgi:hypothetical protein
MLLLGRMPASKLQPPKHVWTAAELRRLPSQERDALLATAAALAENDYRTDRDLTAFDAFGKEDLHGHSSGAGDKPR